jgi:repressor of nif and glnA expression
MKTDSKDVLILEIIKRNKAIDLKSIRELVWKQIDDSNLADLNIGERITRMYLKEYIRKSPSYDGYHITRKGKKVLEQALVE